MDIDKTKILKGFGIASALGLVIGGGISALYPDLSWFCQYGLISYVPNCSNHIVYPLLMVFTAVVIYVMIMLLFLLAKVWKKSS